MHFGHNRRYAPDPVGGRPSPLGPDADGNVKGYRPKFHGDSPTGTGRAAPPPDAGPNDPAGVTNVRGPADEERERESPAGRDPAAPKRPRPRQ